MSRDVAKEKLESLGAKVAGSVFGENPLRGGRAGCWFETGKGQRVEA